TDDDHHHPARGRGVQQPDHHSRVRGDRQRRDQRHERAGGQLRQLGDRPRAGLPVDPGGLGDGDHPDLRRRHDLRHRALHAERRLRGRTRDGGRVQRRRLHQCDRSVPRLPPHADRDGGADVLHRRRRVRRGAGDVQPDGHTAGADDDHDGGPAHHDHDDHTAPDHHHAAADDYHDHTAPDHHHAAADDYHDHAAPDHHHAAADDYHDHAAPDDHHAAADHDHDHAAP